ncbi:MAG: hypothetical protein V4583_00420 [Pseudomonadota bacterium]
MHSADQELQRIDRTLEELIISIELSIRPPFLGLMQSTTEALSERLNLTIYFSRFGGAKRYTIDKVNGRKSSLAWGDTLLSIWLPKPDPAFRTMLQPTAERQQYGRYRWQWTRDFSTLIAMDDMEFHLRPDEARSLEKALFPQTLG